MRSGKKSSGAPAGLVPATSAFDFLEGAFAAAERARKVGTAITLAAIITVTLLALAGIGGRDAKNASRELLAQTQASNTTVLAKLATLGDASGGVGTAEIASHLNERETALKGAIGNEVDVVRIVKQLRRTAPAGVTITAVKFTDAGGSATTTSESGDLGSVEIDGTVTSFALIGTWTQTVAAIPGLTDVNPSWAGGGTAIATTLTAGIDTTARTKRSAALAAGKVK